MRTIPADPATVPDKPTPQDAQPPPVEVPCASCGMPTMRQWEHEVVFCSRCMDHAFLDEWSDQWDDLGGEG